ncbi:DUF6801 domain-containing protein, partial [Streptomyces sp. NPDC006283]|uniref:DUF6801 domain-containing protein n=1 Tax=Streptomyces sp. NPDC006283 TaxID=3156741 RepID=UPI0033BCA6C5
MKTRKSGKTKALAAFAASGVITVGLVGVGAGTAAADPVSIILKYSCAFPLIGQQPLSIKISTDVPKSIPVGQPTPKLKIDAVATVNDTATKGMNMVGAKTLEGEATADATVQVPEGQLPVKAPVTLEKTGIPAQGEFQVNSHGEAPSLTFSKPGKGTITVGDLPMKMTPKDKDGKETVLGTFESACKQDPGQNNKLAEIEITGSGGSTGGTTGGTTGGGTSGGSDTSGTSGGSDT